MRGAISKENIFRFQTKSSLYDKGEYIDYKSCFNSIVKHIINPNSNNYDFNFFCHGWNYDLENELTELYQPKKKLFEDNNIYASLIESVCGNKDSYGGVSHALSLKKSIELKEEYEKENNIAYDIIILYRYDILLWKDMILNNYNNLEENIYCNGFLNGQGDFHFIMSNKNSNNFKNLFNSVTNGNPEIVHCWINNYVKNYMRINMVSDNIKAGVFQDVMKGIQDRSISKGHLTNEQLESYTVP